MNDAELTAAERAALDGWETLAPPAGFAERVLTVAAAEGTRPRSGWWQVLSSGKGLALVGVAAVSMAVATATFIHDRPVSPASRASAHVDGAMQGEGIVPEAEDRDGEMAPFPADVGPKIDAYVESYGRLYGEGFRFHGVVLVARRGEVAYSRPFGFANLETREPNTEDTRFRLGSLSAQLTAAAVLKLEEDGKLSVDDALEPHLNRHLGLVTEGLGEKVTLHHLLTHTSGIFNFTDHVDYFQWRDQGAEPREIVDAALRVTELNDPAEPGSEFNPSNTGYLLLGQVVESVSGMAFSQYVRKTILDPAGMDGVSFGDAYATVPQATGYTFREDTESFAPARSVDPVMFGGAAGFVGTARDLLAWDQALYDDKLLKRQSVERMYTPGLGTYGYSWVVGRAHGQRMVSHPGGIEGFNGAILRFLADRTVVVVLSNTEVLDTRTIASNVADIAYGKTVPPHAEYEEVAADPDTFGRYISGWKLTDASREGLLKRFDPSSVLPLESVFVVQDDDRLVLQVPHYGRKWMHRMAEDTFFFKDEPGTTAQFGLEGGKPEWMTITQGPMKLLYKPDPDAVPPDTTGWRAIQEAVFGG